MTRGLWLIALIVPGGLLLALGVWLARWHRQQQGMSGAWLREVDRKEARVEFQGVGFKWPINKVINESASFNARRLRKRA
jgi:hypothetical protein